MDNNQEVLFLSDIYCRKAYRQDIDETVPHSLELRFMKLPLRLALKKADLLTKIKFIIKAEKPSYSYLNKSMLTNSCQSTMYATQLPPEGVFF